MLIARSAMVVAGLLMPAPAVAQAAEPAPAPAEHRLSPEQIEAVLAEAAKKREAAEGRLAPGAAAAAEEAPGPQVQGEFGVSVGTGGYREVFGTAFYPMGNDGGAAISLDFIGLGKRRDRR
jgi:hypothetical protein